MTSSHTSQQIPSSPYFPYVYSKNPLNLLFSIDQFLSEFFLKVPQRTKSSDYKLQLQEKKKFSVFYGHIPKSQLQKYFRESELSPGEFSKNVLRLLESRLDVVLFRSEFAQSIPMARQLITHKKVRVNQKIVTHPSSRLRPGDVISVDTSQKFRQTEPSDHSPYHFESWNFSKKSLPKGHLDSFLHVLLKKIQNHIDEIQEVPTLYVYTKKRSQGFSSPWKFAVLHFLSTFSFHDLEKSMFFQDIRKYARKSPQWNRQKPLHVEISPKTSTIIFLYSPQRVYFPYFLDFDLLKLAAYS